MLDRAARESPQTVALEAPGREPVTYGELYAHVQTTRSALRDAGVQPGEAVAVALPNGPELIRVLLAIGGLGACAPLDPALTETEYQYYLARLGARTLVIAGDAGSPASLAAQTRGMQVLQMSAAGEFGAIAGAAPELKRRRTDAAVLLFTSSTTGAPKLVPRTWANWYAIARNDERALELTAQDRYLGLMPLFHATGLGAVLTQLWCGGAVISLPGVDVGSILRWVEDFRPTWFNSNVPLNRVILTLAREHGEVFRRAGLRLIRPTGATPDPQLLEGLEEATGALVLDGYGLTETGGVTRNTRLARRRGSAGRSSGLELAIVDARGNAMPAGECGEISMRGPTIASEYLDDPEANRKTFQDGWFRSGDTGYLDHDGFLFITGRLKETIDRGGEKILPQEVDAVLAEHPSVEDAVAFAIPHPTLGQEVAAAVVLREGATATVLELRRFVATRLAAFKVPRRIEFVDCIPRTMMGKPRRGVLSEMFGQRKATVGAQEWPTGSIEGQLIEIWRRILKTQHIGAEDDFFELGGDSMSAAMMLLEVQRTLQAGEELFERTDFFDVPTVATLAGIVREFAGESSEDTGHDRVLALRRSGSRAPLFCFTGSFRSPFDFRELARCLGPDRPVFVVCNADPMEDGRLLPIEEHARRAVEAIQRTRPQGPYLLAGHCFGGVVAFEAGRQLLERSQALNGLVLFDAETPGYPKIHRHWRRYLTGGWKLAHAWTRGQRPVTAEAVRDHVEALSVIVKRKTMNNAEPVLDPKSLHGIAMRAYVPRPLPAPVIHFMASQPAASAQFLEDPRMGWRDVSPAGFEVRMVNTNHDLMLSGVHAEEIAKELKSLVR